MSTTPCSPRSWGRSPLLLLGLLLPLVPAAASGGQVDSVTELRRRMDALTRDYQARMQELTDRVAAAEAAAREANEDAARARQAAESAPSTPLLSRASSAANAFNPAISVILQGRFARFSGDEGNRPISGFLLGPETGIGPEGLSLGESELDVSANIDDRFYGFFDAALNEDAGTTELEIEEAYLQTLSLPAGLRVKAGKFFSAIGYQNERHSHTWDFIDQPLAYEAMLNTQFLDPGVQLTWVAPTELYVELGAEAFAGNQFPASGAAHRGIGALSLFAKLSGDLGVSSSWKAGLSYLVADPRGRESEDGGLLTRFTGDSNLLVADFVWKWAPQGNFRQRHFIFQTELLHRHEDGALQAETTSGLRHGSYEGDQTGFYLQGVYQFMPRWRIGLRYDELHSANRIRDLGVPTLADRDGPTPRRYSAMLDFSNSEFSRIRIQYNRDRVGHGSENEFFVQYIMSIGSHGAHQF